MMLLYLFRKKKTSQKSVYIVIKNTEISHEERHYLLLKVPQIII